MFHEFICTWFEWVKIGGYAGIFTLMALESSIVPVPSEIVMAPAAFWASQGRMSFFGIVLAGTAGSYVGSLLSYWLASWFQFLISSKKLAAAEKWIQHHGALGVFIARFLPVVRHLISLPAGLFRMPLGRFSLATITGAGLWCWILALFGQKVLGENPELLDSPEQMVFVIQTKMVWFLGAAFILAILYAIAMYPRKSQKR